MLAVALSAPAWAADDAGFYGGVGAGQFGVDVGDFESGIGFDDGDTGFRLFGGWQFNPYFGVELGYLDGGSASETIGDLATLGIEADVAIDVSGFDLYLTGTVPLGEMFYFYGKVGMMSWDADLAVTLREDNGAGGVITTMDSGSESDEDVGFGGGFGFNFGDNASVRVEYVTIDISDADGDFVSANLLWRFR
jgi:OOP family OmpA-OmpF porin